MDRKEHWQQVFTSKGERDLSWFEALPAVSLQMMEEAGLGPDTCVLDVGGGDSRLVDLLAAGGLDCLAVLDVSGAALERAQERLGDLAGAFTWIESDVTAAWSLKPMDIVTNTMGRSEQEFEKGDADGVHASLRVLEPLVRARIGRRLDP
jgi:hypothetical protein